MVTLQRQRRTRISTAHNAGSRNLEQENIRGQPVGYPSGHACHEVCPQVQAEWCLCQASLSSFFPSFFLFFFFPQSRIFILNCWEQFFHRVLAFSPHACRDLQCERRPAKALAGSPPLCSPRPALAAVHLTVWFVHVVHHTASRCMHGEVVSLQPWR